MPTCRIIFVALFFLAVDVHAAEEVFTWTDEKGVVHFSDKKPKNGAGVEKHEIKENLLGVGEANKPEEDDSETEFERDEHGVIVLRDKFGRGEDFWQERYRLAKRKHDLHKDRVKQLEREFEDRNCHQAGYRYVHDDAHILHGRMYYPYGESHWYRCRDLRVKIGEAESELESAERYLTDGLPNEARRAGAPPGWVR